MSDTLSPEETELLELRARRAEVAEKRARRVDASRSALEAERDALADEEAIARLEEEYGPVDRVIAVVQTDLGAVVVRRAKPPAYKRFSEAFSKENAKAYELSEQLVIACLLYPARDKFAAMIEQQPFITVRCASAISTLAGVRSTEVAGK